MGFDHSYLVQYQIYLVRTVSFRQDKFVLVFKISFMCSWQYNKQSFSSGSICKKAAETKIGMTHWGSNCGQSSSSNESFLTHCISHSKMLMSQCTEISISSKRWPKKYVEIWFPLLDASWKRTLSNFCKITHFFYEQLLVTHKCFFHIFDLIAHVYVYIGAEI